MKELLELKSRFGMKDSRTIANPKSMVCQSDFISRVSGEVAQRGRMATDAGGTVPSPQSDTGARLSHAVAQLAPEHVSEADFEQMVQAITDQIMAAV